MPKTQNWGLYKTFSDYKADRKIAAFDGIDGQKRVAFVTVTGNLARIVSAADSVNFDAFKAVVSNVYSEKAFTNATLKSAYNLMVSDVYNVLRAYKPQDGDYPITIDGHESACENAYARIIARHMRADKKGKTHVVGIQVEYVTFGQRCVLNLATDRKQQIQARKWGFNSLYSAFIAKPLADKANDESLKLRQEYNVFIRVSYELRKLTEGTATIKTDMGEPFEDVSIS